MFPSEKLANEVRGEERGTLGDWKNKAGFCSAGLRTQHWPCANQADTEPLDICGGPVPDISLTWYWSPEMLNPYWQLAQRLHQPRHAVCPVYFKSLRIIILNYQCQANARHSSFSQVFPTCSWLNRRLQDPKATKANRLCVFFGDVSPRENSAPGELKKQWSSELPSYSVGISDHFLLLMYNVFSKLAKTQATHGWMDGQSANIPTLSQS